MRTLEMPNTCSVYKIRDYGNDKIVEDKAQLERALLTEYSENHVSVEYTAQSGMKMVMFMSITNDECFETYKDKRKITF